MNTSAETHVLLCTPESPTSLTTMNSLSLPSFSSQAQPPSVFQILPWIIFPTIKFCFNNLIHSQLSIFISLYISIFNSDFFQFSQYIYSNALQMSLSGCSLATLNKAGLNLNVLSSFLPLYPHHSSWIMQYYLLSSPYHLSAVSYQDVLTLPHKWFFVCLYFHQFCY